MTPNPTAAERGAARMRRLLEGPIGPTVARLAAPNIAVAAAQTCVTVADAWYVGRIGIAPLAALALVFPVQTLMSMMSAGAMGGGVSSAVARAMGAGDRDRAEAVVTHAVVIAIGMAAAYTLICAVLARPLFALLGGTGDALDGAVAYAEIVFGAAIVMWIANILAAVLRGTGNMAVPARVLICTAALGVVLSGALTLGWAGLPALGVRGPAVSLVASFTIAAAFMAGYLWSGRAGIAPRLFGVTLRRALFLDILKVGAVACGNALLTIGTILVVTGLVGRFGTAALAGYGLGSRLELILIPVSFGVGGALTALVGANRGARQHARARRIAWAGGLAVFAFTGALGVVVAVWPALWIGLFTTDADAAAVATTYLHIAGPFYGFFGIGMALYFASQGTGNMIWPFTAGTVRFVVAAGLGAVLVLWLDGALTTLFACVAAGLFVFGTMIALSLYSRVWNPAPPPVPARAAAE
ncbi:MAG: MATE family efflux transporter [Rhodospirillaceae bacterium]